MVICRNRFNLYLAVALALLCGCQSPASKRKRQIAALRVHLEAGRDLPERKELVNISREHPVPLQVQKTPFLTEAFIQKAEIKDELGGFALRLQFDRQGTWLLEQYSTVNPGKHFAIFSQFVIPPGEKLNEGRWLAAPKITHRITDGALVFTPDASREEAGQIVLGLNNIARQMKKDAKGW